MKCKTCGNEMEKQLRDGEKFVVCRNCKIKRRLKQKPTYSNIPDEQVRKKAEKDVKSNYQQMLDAGGRKPSRRRRRAKKRSVLPRILITFLILALLAGATWFFFPKIKAKLSTNANTEKENTASTEINANDSIDIKTKTFSIKYERHEMSTDATGAPAFLIYYHFTNNQAEASISAISAVGLNAVQNNFYCPPATMAGETPEMINFTTPIAPKDTILVCQAFSLAEVSSVTIEVLDLLSTDGKVLGQETFTLQN